MLNLLAKKDHSQSEILNKIEKYEFNQIEIDEALKYLKSKNFLNDEKYAYNIINFYYSQKGKNWIKSKIKSKGISENDFELAWQKYKESEEDLDLEFEHLRLKIMTKYQIESFHNIDPNILNKIFNFLVYRGFNPMELIQKWKELENIN